MRSEYLLMLSLSLNLMVSSREIGQVASVEEGGRAVVGVEEEEPLAQQHIAAAALLEVEAYVKGLDVVEVLQQIEVALERRVLGLEELWDVAAVGADKGDGAADTDAALEAPRMRAGRTRRCRSRGARPCRSRRTWTWPAL